MSIYYKLINAYMYIYLDIIIEINTRVRNKSNNKCIFFFLFIKKIFEIVIIIILKIRAWPNSTN